MLTGLSGFANTDVTVLTDAQATKAAVMGELTNLVAQARRARSTAQQAPR